MSCFWKRPWFVPFHTRKVQWYLWANEFFLPYSCAPPSPSPLPFFFSWTGSWVLGGRAAARWWSGLCTSTRTRVRVLGNLQLYVAEASLLLLILLPPPLKSWEDNCTQPHPAFSLPFKPIFPSASVVEPTILLSKEWSLSTGHDLLSPVMAIVQFFCRLFLL